VIVEALESIKGGYVVKYLSICFALIVLLGMQSTALAQSLPKYEIHELGYGTTSPPPGGDIYIASVIDRAANTLWLCTLSFRHTSPITGGLVVEKNECHVEAKGPFPKLANMEAAQKTTPVGHPVFDFMFLWLADQETGDVSVCFVDKTTMKLNNKEVGCVPLTHPNP
jgi:hypothetical protein